MTTSTNHKYTKPAHTYQRWTAEQDAMIERLWNDGYDRVDIGKLIGRTPTAVQSRLSELRKAGYNLPRAHVVRSQPNTEGDAHLQQELPLEPIPEFLHNTVTLVEQTEQALTSDTWWMYTAMLGLGFVAGYIVGVVA